MRIRPQNTVKPHIPAVTDFWEQVVLFDIQNRLSPDLYIEKSLADRSAAEKSLMAIYICLGYVLPSAMLDKHLFAQTVVGLLDCKYIECINDSTDLQTHDLCNTYVHMSICVYIAMQIQVYPTNCISNQATCSLC